MKNQEIKFINKDYKYSILIGENILQILPKKINSLCPRTTNIASIIDDNVPSKFKNKLRNLLKNYKLLFLSFIIVNLVKILNFEQKYKKGKNN